MALSKTEAEVIQNVINRLRCKPLRAHDGTEHQGESDAVHAALTGEAKLYLETWVIPALELLLPGERSNPDLARRLSGR